MPKSPEMLGQGLEKKVYADNDHPDRVVAKFKFTYESPTQFKARWYLTKILHLIAPETIPDIIRAESKGKRIVSQRIHMDSAHHEIIQQCEKIISKIDHLPPELEPIYKAFKEKVLSDPQFKKLSQLFEKLGIDLDTRSMANFVYDEDEKLKYLDNNFGFVNSTFGGGDATSLDLEGLLESINELPGKTKESALRHYEQLTKLLKLTKD